MEYDVVFYVDGRGRCRTAEYLDAIQPKGEIERAFNVMAEYLGKGLKQEGKIMKSRHVRFDDYLNTQLKDPAFKKAFDEEEVFANLAIQIAKEREKRGLSQKDLADLMETKQQAVSRLESADYGRYSLNTLVRLAKAFHKRLQIRFV